MPFPRTWTEELVAEWLHLEGYLVEANMPVMVARAGGRLEADVVGAKISKRTLDIKHVEVGAPAGGRGSIRKLVGKKFSSKMEKAIRSYFKRKFRPVGKVAYRKMYVATYSTEPVRDEFRRLGIEVVQLQDFLKQTVLPTIKRWKENPPFHPKHGGESVQLPESHWLLNLLEHLNSWGMIRLN